MLLDERRTVDAEIDLGRRELVERSERRDPGPTAADVGLDDDREVELRGRFGGEGGIVDDPCPWVLDPEPARSVICRAFESSTS